MSQKKRSPSKLHVLSINTTVLQGIGTNEQSASSGAVDMSEWSGQSDAGLNLSEYCAEKLQCFGESE